MPSRGRILIGGLALLVLLLAALWMWQGLPAGGNRAFILKLRAVKLVGLLTVAAAIAVSTMLFQTVSANRVLTPSIMGFDWLYMLLQTVLVAVLGISGFAGIGKGEKFVMEVVVMAVFAMLLFGTLLGKGKRDIPRMILTGVILGVLFRSAAGLVARLLDPNSFAVVQSATVASFSRIDAGLLPFGVGATVLAIAAALWLAPRLDVMALGRDVAVSLGLHYDRLVLATLALIAVLVAVSTAMVGPVTFFGLVVAGLAHGLARSARHAQLLPVAALIAAVILVGGQTLFERALGQTATLSVVVDFLGGLFFLSLLLKGQIR